MRILRPLVLALASAAFSQTSPQAVDFLKDVQPVLTAKCLACHSGDSAQAGLKLHSRNDLLRGGASGPAIVPGNSAASLLVQRISGQKGPRMPLSGPPLTEETIAQIRAWIPT